MVAAQRFWRRAQYPSTVRGMGGSRVGSAIARLAISLGEQTRRHGAVARWPGGHMLPGRSHLLRMWANKVSHADGLVVDRFCNDRDRFGMTFFCHPGRGIQEFGDLTKRVAYHVH